MALHLVTGYAGEEHVTAQDAGALQINMIGSGNFVFDRLNKFSYSILSNNSIRINSGEALVQGRYVRLAKNTYEDVTIENGATGYNRIDLIVIRYSKDSSSGVETATLAVKKGTQTAGTPTAPSCSQSDIVDGSGTIYEYALYEVRLNGLNISTVGAKFTTQVSLKSYIDNYQTPTASKTEKGIVKVGNNINVDGNGVISNPVATSGTAGVVKVGSNINVDSNGKISVPSADGSTEGVVCLSDMFTTQITETNPQTIVRDATKSVKGVVQAGSNINVSNGTISVPTASSSTAGVVKVGDGLSISSGTLKVSSNNYIEELWPKSSVTVPAHSYKKVQLKKSYSDVKSATIVGSINGVIAQPVYNAWVDIGTDEITGANVSYAFFINPTGSSVTINPNSIYDEGLGFYINYTK